MNGIQAVKVGRSSMMWEYTHTHTLILMHVSLCVHSCISITVYDEGSLTSSLKESALHIET